MGSLRMLFMGAALLLATEVFADKGPPPPPDYQDCTITQQKKNAADDCQECDGAAQDTCEKLWKDKGYTQSCQVKPGFKYQWREVWCKSAPEPTKEPASAPKKEFTPTNAKKGGSGCAVSPESSPWLFMLGLVPFLFLARSSRKQKQAMKDETAL
jgi:hypothetical protein